MPVVRWDKAKKQTPLKDFTNWVKGFRKEKRTKKPGKYMVPDSTYIINGQKYEGFNRKRK